jgi:hypothetical protein
MEGKLQPWKFDAGTIIYSNDLYEYLYFNENINKYLTIGDHDHNFFLVGAKGTGKTLFLNFKSYLYTQHLNTSGYQKYPEDQLCESLVLSNTTFSKEDLNKFSSSEIWTKVWLFILMVIACKTNGIQLSVEIDNLINKNNTVSSLLSRLLNDRKNIARYIIHNENLINFLNNIKNGICIFLDNVDQCLIDYIESYRNLKNSEENSISINVWLNAQFGLISAIYSINRYNSHIKIYTTIRKEVFYCVDSQLLINYKGFSTFLEYSKHEVKEIFEKNIQIMNPQFLTNIDDSSEIGKFLGFTQMPHIVAKNKFGKKRIEDAFDFFYRHTLGRPREIVYLGHEIFTKTLNNKTYKAFSESKKIEEIRWAVNKITEELFNFFLEEIIPSFNKEELTNFIGIIQCNVIPREFISRNLEEILKKYYSYGLIGYIVEENDKRNKYRQMFLTPSEYSMNKVINLPKSKYFLTHPTIDSTFTKIFSKITFYNKYNIIGNNYPFYDVPYMSKLFDVALSFSGKQREYVKECFDELLRLNIKAFYDDHEKTSIWGKDLYQHLDNIYRHYAEYCVVFISKSYIERTLPLHELKSTQNAELFNKHEYLLPVRFDDSELPGLRDTIAYINAERITPVELAKIIKDKINQ